jgi:hypothetical protein
MATLISSELQPHQQYRLVFGVVGHDLASFSSLWELVNAIAHVLQDKDD